MSVLVVPVGSMTVVLFDPNAMHEPLNFKNCVEASAVDWELEQACCFLDAVVFCFGDVGLAVYAHEHKGVLYDALHKPRLGNVVETGKKGQFTCIKARRNKTELDCFFK